MNYLSVCSGIEAASVAWADSLGWAPVAFSEIEPFPCAVLAHHYPSTPNLGDMTKFKDWPDAAIDVLVGGTPCQSFSIAGLRKGLADPRGNLMLTYGAIAAKYRPRWLVWENVPGVLSSNGGADFGAFLGMLGELGYGFAYRVLDAQYFGVAQRRRRVFVVGCLGDWRRAAAVLFERHSLSGHPAPRRESGERPAPTISARTSGGGGLGTDFDCDGGVIRWPADVACTLNAAFGDKQGLEDQHINGGRYSSLPEVSLCLNAGGMGRQDAESETLIPTGGCFDALPFDTTQITSAANYSSPKPGDPCHPLAAGAHAPAIAFGWQNSSSQGDSASEHVTPTLDKSKTPAIAFTTEQTPKFNADQALTLTKQSPTGGGHANAGGQVAIAIQAGALRTNPNSGPDGAGVQTDCAYTLEARSEVQCVQSAMQVRRLTPRECERLQGFPDDYTLIPVRGKPAADGPRYKALGNSMAVPVMRWIGERIALVMAMEQLEKAA